MRWNIDQLRTNGVRSSAATGPRATDSVSPVPLITFRATLAFPPRRVLVAGTSGAGKTTLAVRIAAILGIPHVEIDELFHGPDWTPRPSFYSEVDAFSSRPAWVTEWQYDQVRPLLAQRADLVVWLDMNRATVMRQVLLRTLKRRARRQILWNGNIEPPLRTVFTDPDHIVRWAWKTHAHNAERISGLLRERPDLPIVRVHTHRQAREWLAGPLRNSRTTP